MNIFLVSATPLVEQIFQNDIQRHMGILLGNYGKCTGEYKSHVHAVHNHNIYIYKLLFTSLDLATVPLFSCKSSAIHFLVQSPPPPPRLHGILISIAHDSSHFSSLISSHLSLHLWESGLGYLHYSPSLSCAIAPLTNSISALGPILM